MDKLFKKRNFEFLADPEVTEFRYKPPVVPKATQYLLRTAKVGERIEGISLFIHVDPNG